MAETKLSGGLCRCGNCHCAEGYDPNERCDYCSGRIYPCQCGNTLQTWNYEYCYNKKCRGLRSPATFALLESIPLTVRECQIKEMGTGHEDGKLDYDTDEESDTKLAQEQAFKKFAKKLQESMIMDDTSRVTDILTYAMSAGLALIMLGEKVNIASEAIQSMVNVCVDINEGDLCTNLIEAYKKYAENNKTVLSKQAICDIARIFVKIIHKVKSKNYIYKIKWYFDAVDDDVKPSKSKRNRMRRAKRRQYYNSK